MPKMRKERDGYQELCRYRQRKDDYLSDAHISTELIVLSELDGKIPSTAVPWLKNVKSLSEMRKFWTLPLSRLYLTKHRHLVKLASGIRLQMLVGPAIGGAPAGAPFSLCSFSPPPCWI